MARLRLNDIMDYLGIMPAYDDRYVIVLDPPTIFQSSCTHFLHPADPNNQQECGRANMAKDYIEHTRARPPFVPLPPERLLMIVSPFRSIANKDVTGLHIYTYPRDVSKEGAFIFDDHLTAITGSGDYRWRGLGAVAAHEVGHILLAGQADPLTDVRDAPQNHNLDYPFGCIMKDMSLSDMTRSYRDQPLIFCRTTDVEEHPEMLTCHGLLRSSFGLPYEVEH